MSSFIIDKKEYAKAAGLMYGIEESKRDKHHWFLENVRKEFEHAYLLNVISVNGQYGDSVIPDEKRYDEVFDEHRRLARKIYECDCFGAEQPVSLRDLRPRLQHFFQSVLYQIEDETCHRTVAAWLYTCVVKLYEREIRAVEGWWGEIELQNELELKAA